MSPVIAYLTDVEGAWSKLVDFCRDNPHVSLVDDRLEVAAGALFVFGGDAIDRGPAARRVVATLLAARTAQPERVVLLAGNRDINKLRLVRELRGSPPERAPRELAASRGQLLRWIFAHTMGAAQALDHRRAELRAEGRADDDDAAASSYLDDLRPEGASSRYLAACRLAFRCGETLFVHGAVDAGSLGFVPGCAVRIAEPDAWVTALDAFYAASVASFRAAPDDRAGYASLIAYQAPLRGQRDNPTSVVYGRLTDDDDTPVLPAPEVIAALRASGIRRLVVGHSPSGDCPAVLRDGEGFELVFGDNSYGRIERGSQIFVDPGLRIAGETELDGGERRRVAFAVADEPSDSPLGLRDERSGLLVKARLAGGDYLCFRSHRGRRVEQVAFSAAELASCRLSPPRRAR